MLMSAVGNIVSGAIGAASSEANTNATNAANAAINKENLDFQREQNEIMRQREDNAIQRRSADLEKAGINKLLAGTDGASASGGLGAPSMIPMQKMM